MPSAHTSSDERPSAASIARSSSVAHASVSSGSASMLRRSWRSASDSPARSEIATVAPVAPTSIARTRPAAAWNVNSPDGRPPVEAALPDSVISPRALRSPRRAPIVVRDNPVCSISSERVEALLSRIRFRMSVAITVR